MRGLINKIDHKRVCIAYSLKVFLLLVFCFVNIYSGYAKALNKGLYFYSHKVTADNRTSLILNNDEPYSLKVNDVFQLEFNLHLRNEEENRFGYIFKLIADNKESYNLLLNNHNEIFFIYEKKDTKEEFKKIYLGKEEDLAIKVTLDKRKSAILLKINDKELVYKSDLAHIASVIVSFGECDKPGFRSNDVPPMVLSNLKVSKNNKILSHWTFDRYNDNEIFDSLDKKVALFKNGKMLIDHSIYWQKLTSIKAEVTPQITFDSLTNEVVILGKDKATYFSLDNNKVRKVDMNNIPYDLRVNHLVFDYTKNNLLFYNFTPPKLNYFDKEKNTWTDRVDFEKHEYIHHNRYVSVKDSALFLYGGYGHYRYKGVLFKVDLRTGKWNRKDLSKQITPRYLAAMGGNKDGSKIYLLGGKGAEMGLQELSPKNFFDLYEIDPQTLQPKLLYNKNEGSEKELVFSNSLVVDDKNEFIYVLAYPNEKTSSSFQLKRIGIEKPTIESYGNSIEFFFKDEMSYCDLFFSPSLAKLIAVVAYSKDDKISDIDIYSLDFPPLKAADVFEEPGHFSFWKWVIGLIVIGTVVLIVYKRRKQGKHITAIPEIASEQAEEDTAKEEYLESEDVITDSIEYYNRNISSILFLGEFQVFDKDGKEITEDFSPTLKYLLVLILLYTTKNEKGISSSRLEEILWFGKSEKSAINNRNVNIRKLRLLLENLGNIEVANKNSYWSIVLPEDAFSDYIEILNLSKYIKGNINYSIEKVHRLLELLSYGELLPNIQYEWIDSFKSEFSNLIIDTLTFIIRTENDVIRRNGATLLKITDTIFIFDPINEDALEVKCQTLYALGKKSLAKNAYENFSKRYYSLLGEEFTRSLKDLIDKQEDNL